MHIYFVRHGLASWPAWSGSDTERQLTPVGVRLIEDAAAGLARRRPPGGGDVGLILHSPLVRARQTAEIIAAALSLSDYLREQRLLGPGFDLKALKKLLKEHSQIKTLMLVGHNPDMAEVVGGLTGKPVRFKEGTVAYVKLKRSEPDRASLVWLASAEDLAEEG